MPGAWERPISIYRVNYCHITQLRAWLPDAVGGLMWFAPHVPHTSVYAPVYSGALHVPDTYTNGSMAAYDRGVMWWAHSFVSNFAHLKWSYMIVDIAERQAALEAGFFEAQPALEAKAVAALAAGDEAGARALLRAHSEDAAAATLRAWRSLGDFLVTKYNNGYVNTPGDIENVGTPVGYPTWWLEAVGFGRFPEQSPTKCKAAKPHAAVASGDGDAGADKKLRLLREQVRQLGAVPAA